MARRTRLSLGNSLAEIDDARSDYRMAKRSGAQKRRVRGVPTQGAGADYHYRNESDWLWMGELAWDIYRDNMIVQSILERAIENQVQDGFAFDPDTGDPKLDADLVDWWLDVSEDTSECDPANELTFADQTEMVLRSTLVAGDIFGIPMEDGTVDMREFHLCRSPTWNTREKKNIFHGVEKNPVTRRRLNYWFLPEPIDPTSTIKKTDLTPYPAYNEDGERNVFHVRFPRRSHQTRGITAFAPIFDVAGYHDDVQFLKLVQARAASLFVFVRKRAATFDPAYLAAESRLGLDVTRDKSEEYESNQRQYSEVGAGSVLGGLPGEEINPWSANIPNPEFFPHVKMLLTFLGLNFGMPLVMALMDASETNFSGYRGAVDQARLGFRKNQKRLAARWYRPYLRFKILHKALTDKTFAKWVEKAARPNPKVNIFKHRWHPPTWPYIDPYKDAAADLIRDANMQISPRRRCRERGFEWSDIARETVEDRGAAIELAMERAAAINAKFSLEDADKVRWRDLAPLPNPERVSMTVNASSNESTGGTNEPA